MVYKIPCFKESLTVDEDENMLKLVFFRIFEQQ